MIILVTTFISVFALVSASLIIASIANTKRQQKFNEKYLQFLRQHEGVALFCYTNRLAFCGAIESVIIPQLDKHVQIVKLIGKDPQTDLDKEYIAHMLFNLKEVGFPNVMRIVNGRVIDRSLHRLIYNSINNNTANKLPLLVNNALNALGNTR